MISYENLPKTKRLTSTFLQDYPETFKISLTLQLLSFVNDVNLASDSKRPPVIAWILLRSVRELAMVVSVLVVVC